MTKNIEKRIYKKTPLNHEMNVLTLMVKERQQKNIIDQSIEDIEAEVLADPDSFLNEISPQFQVMEKIKN